MTIRNLFEQARRLHLPSLWKAMGLKLKMHGQKGQSGFCPHCGPASQRDDATSLFQTAAGIWRWHCFRCGSHGTTIDLVALVEHCSAADAARKLATERSLTAASAVPDVVSSTPRTRSDPEAVAMIVARLREYTRAMLHRDVADYLERRGIRRATQAHMADHGLLLHLPADPRQADALLRTVVGTELLAAAGLIRDAAHKGFTAAAFRPLVFVSHDERALEFRSISATARGPKALQYGDPFAPLMLYPSKRVSSIMLVEGGVDLMSAWQMFTDQGRGQETLFVGFFGASKWRMQWLDALHIQHPDAEFVIATDADKAGDEAATNIRKALPATARCRRLRPQHGDWNLDLQHAA